VTITTNIKQNNLSIVMALAITTLLSLAFVLLLSPTKASAATITVGGACTLDEAVGAMNAATDQNGCVATGPAYGTDDTISLPAGVFVSGGTGLAVSATVTGAGVGLTIIDGGDTNSGVYFDNPGSTLLSGRVENLSVRGVGSGDAGIGSQDFAMTITNVEVYSQTSNAAGTAISVEYTSLVSGITSTVENAYIHDMTIEGSAISFTSYGGANSVNNIVRNNTVTNVDNQGSFLGALNVFGSSSVTDVVFENNTFVSNDFLNPQGGAIIAGYADSALEGGDSTATITARNNTIVAGRDMSNSGGAFLSIAIALASQTVSSSITLQNNLVAGYFNGTQEIGTCGTFVAGAGGTETVSQTSTGGNITDDTLGASCLNHPTDQSGVTGLASSLGSLQDNGGITPTIALLSGSPAIDGGVANSLTTDQRGIARPQGSAYDSGAFELAINTEEPGTTDSTNSEDEELANTGQSRGLLLGLAVVFLGTPMIVVLSRRVHA
jgi:hypothetical protein